MAGDKVPVQVASPVFPFPIHGARMHLADGQVVKLDELFTIAADEVVFCTGLLFVRYHDVAPVV